jgi:hypothetical protein
MTKTQEYPKPCMSERRTNTREAAKSTPILRAQMLLLKKFDIATIKHSEMIPCQGW